MFNPTDYEITLITHSLKCNEIFLSLKDITYPTRYETMQMIRSCKKTIRFGEFAIENLKEYAYGKKFPKKIEDAEARIVMYQQLIAELDEHLRMLHELEKMDKRLEAQQDIIDRQL